MADFGANGRVVSKLLGNSMHVATLVQFSKLLAMVYTFSCCPEGNMPPMLKGFIYKV